MKQESDGTKTTQLRVKVRNRNDEHIKDYDF